MPVFLDSNVVLYALSDDDPRRATAVRLLGEGPSISTQVVSECSHVLRRKLRLTPAQVAEDMNSIIEVVRLVDVGLREIRLAWEIAGRYGFSHYDSLIVATALTADCDTLYTEDLQHGQVIDRRITLVNPFLPKSTV